ncbi:quinolinate synthase [Rhodanobacter sp. FW510-R12]|uniref:quinolinate synthase NadA n=1 Tax=unclassified Rhodanobacter TaxID=2621553 RepID=UPI0007AA2EA8|nr:MULTISPECIES: quinolinate synthase NadA [unclassified Rhodanobacter]KZC15392.1 quinolinate synthase [Rhodanobacter sp. FW104-R8]KZC25527.1 quinolinate synthase [Rhodanobacter sp. FW510-T8]KZC29699.1 quinolinate synthase [Rhodanobacter sp. FW510-R10]
MTASATLPVPVWRDELEHEYAALAERLEPLVPCLEIPLHLPWIDAINKLKKLRGAVIMAHSYQSPEIFHGVADITGDSLGLAQAARDCDADLIVVCGVHFMAESAKILAPEKTVLLPDLEAGCSLASSITAADVRALRAQHPGAPVVSYANTSAAVKAESDAICTSANAVQVVESMGAARVIFLPDEFLGRHVASQTRVELVLWHGRCEVHEKFTAQEVRHVREQFGTRVVAHPECSPEVLAEADFVGSTTAMGKWLAREKPARVAMITECSMADNLKSQFPATEFIKPCNLCPHMQRITLPNIYAALRDMKHAIEIPAGTIAGARRALERMLAVGRRETV